MKVAISEDKRMGFGFDVMISLLYEALHPPPSPSRFGMNLVDRSVKRDVLARPARL